MAVDGDAARDVVIDPLRLDKPGADVSPSRVLIAIPAHNEAPTIRGVVERILRAVSGSDVLVVDDGSDDGTAAALDGLPVMVASHYCNLGYGRSVQTALRFAALHEYHALVTLDADGQHHPEQIPDLLEAFDRTNSDLLIGSRYVQSDPGNTTPWPRRTGMWLFSNLVKLTTGTTVKDTSSGFRVVGRRVFHLLTRRSFVDFHAEIIVYLLCLGYRVTEFPINVSTRLHGRSMYGPLNYLKYPAKMLLVVPINVIEARLIRRRARS
jgi:glycosyltransferase involved in cell wall biosynthesis